MLEEILPTQVASYETFEDPAEATLFPEEEALICDSVELRRREFTSGRYCARQALARLGFSVPQPVLQGVRGAPVWPRSVRGSITHCRGYRAAAVAKVAELASVGIDAEPNLPLPDGILEAVALPAEQIMVKELLTEAPEVRWDRLLFSAKESIYKTWYPLTRRPLEFEDALIDFDPAGGTFSARLLSHVRSAENFPRRIAGRWITGNGLVVTAIALSAASGSSVDSGL
ncbi:MULTISPECIES: 4'-phosphopantetheinyl transferase family protein [Streptomyces]|uniref:4'-phosphopantetheinyl transferase family protein n=1 Tax=Streptomyces TaxID=1883 RepID=UPI00051726DF|nr:4'-phosphopantetheinyl transferase superfamily protein [Streptomyces sp. CNS654]